MLYMCVQLNFLQKINKWNDSVSCIKLNSVRSGGSRTYACLVHIISTASRNGIGVVLMQEGRPISFESRPIKGNYLYKAIYENEML